MTLAARSIRQRTPEWHAARQAGVTATDLAVIVGETGSVTELAALKLGKIEPPEIDPETRLLMDDGLALQPFLLDAYRRRTGAKVRAVNTTRRSRRWPIAMCSPDGEVVGERRGLELKMTASPRWPEAHAAGDPVPGDVFAQVQWQMYVAEWEAVDVVALLYGRVRVIPIERDAAYIEDALWAARRFWAAIERGELPEPDGSEAARRALGRMYPRDNGTLIAPTLDLIELAEQLREARAAKKAADQAEGTIGNAIRTIVGEASGVDGVLTLHRNSDHTRTNWPAVAKAYRGALGDAGIDLDCDAIESIHSETVQGVRVLRLLKEKGQ